MSTAPRTAGPTQPRYPPQPRSEPHWPPLLCIAVAIVLEVLLPHRLIPGPSWLFPALESLMLAVLFVSSPQRLIGEHARRRLFALIVTALVSVANAISLCLLVSDLLHHQVTHGKALIIAGVLIWFTNVLVFSLWFWETDRGGPGRRAAARDGPPDFLFPQMSDRWVSPEWRPIYLDYLYVSITNATAFSPTDTMPLTPTAKAVMGLQSLISLVTILLVVSRAVGIL